MPSAARLTVNADAGLANRMRVICSALAVAEAQGRPLRVIWYRNNETGARFEDLFEPIVGDVQLIERWAQSKLVRRAVKTVELVAARLTRRVGTVHHQPTYLAAVDRALATPGRRSYLRTYYPLVEPWSDFGRLVPTAPIRASVEELRHLADGGVGVHLRMGDPQDFGDDVFERVGDLLECELRERPQAPVFVASDDRAAVEALRGRFGDRVRSAPISATERSNATAISGALVDMLLLARTDVLLATPGSSFSETAAMIGGARLTLADEHGARSVDLVNDRAPSNQRGGWFAASMPRGLP